MVSLPRWLWFLYVSPREAQILQFFLPGLHENLSLYLQDRRIIIFHLLPDVRSWWGKCPTSCDGCIHQWNSCLSVLSKGLVKLWSFSGFVDVKKNFSNALPQIQLHSCMYYFKICKIGDFVHICDTLDNARMYSAYLNSMYFLRGKCSKSCMAEVPWSTCISSDTLCVININWLTFLFYAVFHFCYPAMVNCMSLNVRGLSRNVE